ncbi:hypothetical protein PHYBOEH_002633 [Phytophthora boehmeriae]|uniref:Thioredoxin domain-containing protein n=1 Tax=Phytophthora boehmeriae TaxID=109152 RepID=A0A8T1WQB0_9STRA|nr:hypothetical protein PHYBOEH_002633 [Phytophthora boehmeriae]
MIAVSKAEDFHSAVTATQDKPLVVCFTASWCNGCKLVTPTLQALSEELQSHATFVSVDAEQLETLCEEVEVDNFPHFRVYRAGKATGDLTSSKADKLDEFIRGMVTTAEAPVAAEAQEKEQETATEEAADVQAMEETPAVEEAAAAAEAEQEQPTDAVQEEEVAGVIAETLQEVVAAEVAAEGAAAEKEVETSETMKVDEDSKKRQGREESEVDSEQTTKKAKTEEQEVVQEAAREEKAIADDAELTPVDSAVTEDTGASVVSDEIPDTQGDEAHSKHDGVNENEKELAIHDEASLHEETATCDKIDVVEEAASNDHLDATGETALIDYLGKADEVTASYKPDDAREDGSAVSNAPAA